MDKDIAIDRLSTKEVIISGFALFSMYFGAGNMIIPPMMGLNAGTNWLLSWIGFSISGVGLIVLGMRAMARCQGELREFGGRIGKHFGLILGAIIILCIGPLMSVPRTAATVHEVAVVNINPNISIVITSLVFFLVTWYFSIEQSKIIDIIGGYMTPLLLIVLAFIIIKGVITPISTPVVGSSGQLGKGFLEGYQTMDSIGSLILATMILNDFRNKGVKTEEGLARYTTISGIIAAVGLALVYGGLTYLGATAYSIEPEGVTRSDLLSVIVTHLIGKNGSFILYIGITLACITTSIGLTSAFGNFFNDATDGKVSYKLLVTISVLVSFLLSILGVDKIMEFSIPVLVVVYPIVIVLMLLNIFDNYFSKDVLMFRLPVILTGIISLIDGIKTAGFKNFFLVEWAGKLPLASQDLQWIPVAILGFILALIIVKIKDRDKR